MSKLSKAKTDLTFLKNRLNEMKEHPWRAEIEGITEIYV